MRHSHNSTLSSGTILFLVRHGETDWNSRGRLLGQKDVTLNETGVRQSYQVAAWLAEKGTTLVVSSTLTRALQTADVIADSIGTSPILDSRLAEINAGLWTGRDKANLVVEEPEIWYAWRDGSENVIPKEAESYTDLQARALEALEDICRKNPQRIIAIVTHHGVIRSILAYILGYSIGQIEAEYDIVPASTTTIVNVHGRGYEVRDVSETNYMF